LETPPSPNRLWRWAASGLAVAMLALIGAVALRPEGQGARVADRRPAAPASASVMGRARELMDQSQPHKALVVLRAAVEDEAAPQGAGALYGLLGDAAFQTRRYEEAHRYYEEARRRYEDEWLDTITPERSFVVNLLAETRPANYMPLHDLDFAGSQGGEALAEYERILARHPGAPHLASLTTARMCELVAPSESGAGPETRVAALRALREQCGDPVAAGQLDIELGRLQQGLGELEAARTAFERASSAPDPAVAERAEGLLARVRAEGR
jgi:tetratricopeptide (TPR) repeat protein